MIAQRENGPIRGPRDFAATFEVSREAIERLEVYERLLRQWQKAVNLVAAGTLDAIWHRHFADSAQLFPLAPPRTRSWVDLGSGAGFPGLVIAILLASPPSPRLRGEGRGEGQHKIPAAPEAATQRASLPTEGAAEQVHIALIESDTRKAAFLREVVRQTGIGHGAGLTVDILSTRAESVRIPVNERLPRAISARALAPLNKLLELAAPLSPPGTTLLLCKGKEAAKEVQAARETWNFDVELVPSVTDKSGVIAVITNLERKAKD